MCLHFSDIQFPISPQITGQILKNVLCFDRVVCKHGWDGEQDKEAQNEVELWAMHIKKIKSKLR